MLPSLRPRYCLTFWLNSDATEGDAPVRLPRGADEGAMRAALEAGM